MIAHEPAPVTDDEPPATLAEAIAMLETELAHAELMRDEAATLDRTGKPLDPEGAPFHDGVAVGIAFALELLAPWLPA